MDFETTRTKRFPAMLAMVMGECRDWIFTVITHRATFRTMDVIRRIAYGAVFCLLFHSASIAQTCDPDAWAHVYHPQRLKVVQACVTVTGTLVDATHGRNHDGARHEPDGDTHAWLKLDQGQEKLLLPGNVSTQQGNMVFELTCYYRVTQADAKPACQNYRSKIHLPRLGSHIAITGALIEDLDHKPIHREIHPVTAINILGPGR